MKKRMKLLIILFSVLAFALAGCGLTSSGEGVAEEGNPKYAVILKTLSNPYWVAIKEGIEEEASKIGVEVEVLAATSEDDTQGQMNLFEDLLSKDYAGIGFAPLSPVNLINQVVAANEKGIQVVNIDEQVDMDQLQDAGGSVYAFVTTDNKKVGAKGAQFIVDTLGTDGGQVAIIEGKAGNATGEARKTGATEIFESTARVDLVSSQPGDWDRIKALDLTTNLIQRYPDLKAIYAANDTMAPGALEAIKSSDKEIIVVGTDGQPEALDAVQEGRLSATIAQDPGKIGATSLAKLVEAVEKKADISRDSTPITESVESKLITKH